MNPTKIIGKPGVFFYLRLVIAVVLLWLVLRLVDFHEMGATLASIKPQPIIAALLIMLLNYCLKTYRWALILWIRRPDLSFGRLARFNFISIFLGNFLATSVSSDIARVYYVSQHTADPRSAISSIFADRIIGTFALSIVAFIAFLGLLNTNLFPIGSVLSHGIVAFLVLSLALPLTIRNTAVLQGIPRLFERFAGTRFSAGVKDMCEHLRSYGNEAAVMLKALSISFINVFIAVVEFYLIAKGFSAQVWIGYFFLFIPLVSFLATFPVSIGGMGLVEVALIFFFSKVGMPLEMCFGTAVVYRALQLICMLPGAGLYLLNGFVVKELSA